MKKLIRTPQIILGLMLLLPLGHSFAIDNSQSALQANSRYVIKGGEVYDLKTELTWQRCSVGQRWSGEDTGCVGTVKTFNFDNAQQLSNGKWRVPTKDELQTLIDQSKVQAPKIDKVAFPNMDTSMEWYWSRTPYGDSAPVAWGVLFHSGEVYKGYGRSNAMAVRLVRDGS